MLPKFDTEYDSSKFLETIQEEQKLWQEHNFPGRESWVPLIGLVEELGELEDSMSSEEVMDAIGDCFIYLADYCNAKDYNLQELYNKKDNSMVSANHVIVHIGKLAHAHLKNAQQIRMHEDHDANGRVAIRHLIGYLTSYHPKETVQRIIWGTWVKVRQRDWQANRNTAHEEVK